jgi:hypothetical protein
MSSPASPVLHTDTDTDADMAITPECVYVLLTTLVSYYVPPASPEQQHAERVRLLLAFFNKKYEPISSYWAVAEQYVVVVQELLNLSAILTPNDMHNAYFYAMDPVIALLRYSNIVPPTIPVYILSRLAETDVVRDFATALADPSDTRFSLRNFTLHNALFHIKTIPIPPVDLIDLLFPRSSPSSSPAPSSPSAPQAHPTDETHLLADVRRMCAPRHHHYSEGILVPPQSARPSIFPSLVRAVVEPQLRAMTLESIF